MRFLDWGWSRAPGPQTLAVLTLAMLLQPGRSDATPQLPRVQPAAQEPGAPHGQSPVQEGSAPGPLARAGGFTAMVEMVRVPVVVVDDKGAFIRDLRPSDFTVKDGGKSHRVDHFVSDNEPATVGIVVDASATMSPYIDHVRAAVMLAVNNLRPDDELFLITYGAVARKLSPRSTDKSAFAIALAGYAPEGNERALFDAIELGLATLEDATYDKRSLLVVGADADTASDAGELAVQQDLRRAGVSVHAIVLTDRSHAEAARVNRAQTIPEIVRFTGGLLAQRPTDAGRYGGLAGWLEIAGADISTYVKHQYLLHYTPTNPPRPGTWRSISVRVAVDYKQVRARSGYMR